MMNCYEIWDMGKSAGAENDVCFGCFSYIGSKKPVGVKKTAIVQPIVQALLQP